MAHTSFGNGWPDCDRSAITILRRADGLVLPVHRDVAELVAILLDLTEAVGLDVRPGETWGYACRAISGTKTASNHSWGTAVDINAPANPYASAAWHTKNGNTVIRGKRLKTEFTDEIVKMWEGQGFRWGGWYVSKPDPMHFEYMGTAAEAREAVKLLHAFFANLEKPVAAAPAKPAPQKPSAPATGGNDVELPELRQGSRGEAVEAVQALVNDRLGVLIKTDGIFGGTTDRNVRRYQKSRGLSDDGIVGPNTWRKLLLSN